MPTRRKEPPSKKSTTSTKSSKKQGSLLKKKPPTLDELEDELDITLPDEVNEPPSDLSQYNILIYGRKGIGKTSLCARFPESFNMQFEPGGKSLKTFQRAVPDWLHFRKYLNLLEDSGSDKYRNLVIDTGKPAYDRCLEYACAKNKLSHPSDAAYGAGWKMVADEFNRQMTRAMSLDMGFIVICHDQDKEIETKSGRKFMKCCPDLSGQADGFFAGPIDLVGYYHFDGNERWLQIRGDDYTEAKCRFEENFIALDGTPVHLIPMGNSPEESYENFIRAFNNEQELSYAPEENKLAKKKPAASKAAKPKTARTRRR